MTHYIGNVEVPAINDVSIGSSISVKELDIVSYDENLIFESSPEASEVEITFSLVESIHGLDYNVEDQRDELRGIVDKKPENNSFAMGGLRGHLAVTDISLGESGDIPTIREGTISAIYLPWPKYFPNQPEPIPTDDEGQFGRLFGRKFGG